MSNQRAADRSRAAVRILQVLATMNVVVLAWQFGTAGTLFSAAGALGSHAVGAVVLHVISALTAAAAALLWWRDDAPWWPGAMAAVVFGLGFVQAYYGAFSTLWVHVPGAMVLTVGAVWVMVWSVSPVPFR